MVTGPASGPLGRRHADPRHAGGEWDPPREAAPDPATQGTGRPWSGARFGPAEGQAVQDPLDRLIEAHRRGADPATIAELTRDAQRHEAQVLRRLDHYLRVVGNWAVRSGQMTQIELDQMLADVGVGEYPDPPPRGNPLRDPEFLRRHYGIEVAER